MKNQLASFRAKKGWTLSELASSVAVSKACINAIENGSFNPSLELAYDTAEALETTVVEVFQPTPRRVRLEQTSSEAVVRPTVAGLKESFR